jgi:hypothetical protein
VLIVFRVGDIRRMSWSPIWTLRRLLGNTLFTDVGPEISHQRNVLIRAFNNTKSNSEMFDTIIKIATAHTNALASEGSTVEVDDITYSVDNFAIALWGEILYANPNRHVDGDVMNLSKTMNNLIDAPWPVVWYFLQLLLKLVTPDEPTRSEAKLRARVAKVVQRNMRELEEYERNNPDAPMKAIRNVSVMTGGGRIGPLSKFASEFANLNLFGSYCFIH